MMGPTTTTIVYYDAQSVARAGPTQRHMTRGDRIAIRILEACGFNADMSFGEFLAHVMKCFWVVISVLFIVLQTFDGSLARNWDVFASITWLIAAQNFAVILAVIGTTSVCWLWKPLRFSWLALLPGASKDHAGDNIHIAPIRVPWLGLFYGTLVLINLPALALLEEKLFRQGAVDWSSAFGLSLVFGLVHCIVGVPIAAGIGLSVAGLWFHYQCFEGGVVLSTVHHTAYNLIILTPMVIGAAFSVVARKEKAHDGA